MFHIYDQKMIHESHSRRPRSLGEVFVADLSALAINNADSVQKLNSVYRIVEIELTLQTAGERAWHEIRVRVHSPTGLEWHGSVVYYIGS
ncbi:hypothetical protein CEXT_191571 [Caerostris extrusa]|uniref:Uncharacterized protein n=1 Tax=Caerostris extrusa TaxID=172846 RepID=A0AAV4U1N5_CAEEX|nr:hypothetical protein CEXT_191571 [Caerostris extrusa]